MYELSILSIFRDSASYLPRYFDQVAKSFKLRGGKCHAIWLEGDSKDTTFELLQNQKQVFETLGHDVTLIKFELKGPYWSSITNQPSRWRQLATCWNRCLEGLKPSKYTVLVESDLIWDSSTIEKIIPNLSSSMPVICPMLMTDANRKLFGFERFYDIWGFSRNGKKFRCYPPYWDPNPLLYEDSRFLQVSTAGGMIVTTYDIQRQGHWDLDTCIMNFPNSIATHMDKTLKIFHPSPMAWNDISFLRRGLIAIKYFLLIKISGMKISFKTRSD